MTGYSGLWNREKSFRLLLSAILLKYGHYLKWNNCNETILHDGCVDGTLTKHALLPYVNDHVEEIYGFDKWKYIIDVAKKTNKDDKIKYRTYNVMTRNLTEMKSKFDHIFSLFVAETSVPNKVLLRKYRKMLKRSGQIFMVIPASTAVQVSIYIQAHDKKWSKYFGNRKVFENYTSDPVDYFQKLLVQTGFKTEVCELVNAPIVIENFPDMLKLVWPMYGNFWNCIPNNLKDDFLEDNLKICLEMMTYLCAPNKYRMPMDILICIASKA